MIVGRGLAAPLASCAAVGCHGRPPQTAEFPWQSSYAVWLEADPHSGAYDVLYTERSLAIIERLNGGAAGERVSVERFRQEHCASCHATTAVGESAELLAYGVRCDSCHGPADAWLARHATHAWEALPAGEKYAAWRVEPVGEHLDWRLTAEPARMRHTQDLVTQAKVCAECHVGAPATATQPAREVDHDLIAAGHPRLNFEFAAYLANLPAHWDTAKDRQSTERFDAQAWSIGQLVAAEALVSQVHARIEDAAAGDATWPEFAYYDCHACHHALAADSYRQRPQRLASAARDPQPGRLPAGSWQLPFAPLAACGFAVEIQTETDRLTAELEQLATSSSQLGASCTAARDALLQAIAQAEHTPLDHQAQLSELADALPDDPDWDLLAQWYLAVLAFTSDAEARPPQLAKLFEGIDFPVYDSPRHYDPGSFELEEIRTWLRKLATR